MKDFAMLYLFVGLMVFNLVASLVYIFGLDGLKPAFKKSARAPKRR